MSITALTVAREHVDRQIAGVEHRCLSGRIFGRAADVQAAWLDALELVETSHFFYLDDDDQLPDDHLAVLDRCLEQRAAIAYTDEMMGDQRLTRAPYSPDLHRRNPTLAHHLVLCDTEIAREVAAALPRGDYWPELQLFWMMARRGGAAYVPMIGYLWHPTPDGLTTKWWTVRGIVNSQIWCGSMQ